MTGFEPENSTKSARGQSSFGHQQVRMLLAVKPTRPALGERDIQLRLKLRRTWRHGCFHTGIAGTIADSAAGCARFALPQTPMTMHGRPDP